jgi:polygalacturonase
MQCNACEQGMKWWRVAYTGIDNRPRMIEFDTTINILIHDITLLNSPSYHLNLKDCANVVVRDMTIYANSTIERGRDGDRDSVMYPLNTDGIDVAATNVTIYNCTITNYDDAIVAKPCRNNYKYCTCSGDMVAYNNNIYYSTGLTIGSVPPNDNVNCVRNVTFRDSYMYRPLKAIYVKSNPGDSGTGSIDNVVYENIFIEQALWWTVWIGPQQQNQVSPWQYTIYFLLE